MDSRSFAIITWKFWNSLNQNFIPEANIANISDSLIVFPFLQKFSLEHRER